MGQGSLWVGEISYGDCEVDKDDRGEEIHILCD